MDTFRFMIDDLQIHEQFDSYARFSALQHIADGHCWFLAECDNGAGEYRWHHLLGLTGKRGGSVLARMGHDDDHERPACLGVFDSGAVVATYAQPGPSLRSQAARARACLKRNWPEQCFDVRVVADRVHTCWTDGPALDEVSNVLGGCEATAHRLTWRRTRRGIVTDQLRSVILDRRRRAGEAGGSGLAPLEAPARSGFATFWTAHADAARIAEVLLKLADGRDVTVETVLEELGLEAVAAIVDVDLAFTDARGGTIWLLGT